MAGKQPEKFDSIAQIESLAEKAIREGQDRGEFDNLPGHGQPLPDLDTERPAGWWAHRWIEAEHVHTLAEKLRDERATERNRALQLDDVSDLRRTLDSLNRQIVAHNRAATRAEHHVELVDVHEAITLWFRLRRSRRDQRNGWGFAGR